MANHDEPRFTVPVLHSIYTGRISIFISAKWVSILFVCCIAIQAICVHAVKYEIIDLGPLGGGKGCTPTAINDHGQIVGYFENHAGARRAFLWTEAEGIQDLGAIGSLPGSDITVSEAYDINNRGQVVGNSGGVRLVYEIDVRARDEEGNPITVVKEIVIPFLRGFLWENGTLRDAGYSPELADEYPYLYLGQASTELRAINDNGFAVGFGNVMRKKDPAAFTFEFAATWNNGLWTGVANSSNTSWLTDVNENNEAVGWQHSFSITQAVKWSGEGLVERLNPFNAFSSVATAINDAGEIVGYYDGGSAFAILKNESGDFEIHDLNTWGNTTSSWAYDINENQQIVGDGQGTAVLWEPDKMTRLDSLLPEGSDWAWMYQAAAINEQGWIVGTGTRQIDGEYQDRGFLLRPKFEAISIEILGGPHKKDDIIVATVTVRSNKEYPQTITMEEPLLIAGEEDFLEIDESLSVEPFELSSASPTREFKVAMKALKPGIVEVFAGGTAEDSQGNVTVLGAAAEITIRPLDTEIAITPKDTVLNITPDSHKTKKCLEFEAGRESDARWTDCIEIQAVIKNVSEENITDVTVQGADNVLGMITSLKQDQPNVPLEILGYETTAGKIPDSDNPQPVTLEPDKSVTYTWYVGTTDVDALEANPSHMEIEVLSLGALDGKNVRGIGTQDFRTVDKVLLEWGVKPRDGRTGFLSGQSVWVTGILRNVSEEAGKAQTLLVMVYQIPEGNLAGGYLKDVNNSSAADAQPGNEPLEYTIFEIPGEGDGTEVQVEGFFRSMAIEEPTTGEVKYGVRLWTIDDESGEVINADGQGKVAEDWMDGYQVTFAADQPVGDTWIEDCEFQDVPIWLCAMSHGFYSEAMEGMYQLGILGKDAVVGAFDGGYRLLAYDLWLLKTGWDALQGDEEAKQALYVDAYNQYTKYVNLGIMAGEGLSNAPMAFEAFANFAGSTMGNFFSMIERGDMREIQKELGYFVGANPDLLLEPLVALRTASRLRRAVQAGATGLEESLEATRIRQALVKGKGSLEERLAEAAADPKIRHLYKALAAGDELTDAQLRRIYGISKQELKQMQRIARENGITLGFRSRNPVSVALLESGNAYPKPHALEAFKSVNDIDTRFLGYRKEANGILEIVEPPAGLGDLRGGDLNRGIDNYMSQLKRKHYDLDTNEVLFKETKARLKRRVEEWQDAVEKLKVKDTGLDEVDINVNFAGQKQYIHDVVADEGAREVRKIIREQADSITDVVDNQPRRVWKIKMSGPNGGPPKSVTGDIDFLAILDQNGMFITNESKRNAIYAQLAEAIGMQHGESYSFMFQKNREEWLRCCVEGKEPVMTIGPHGKQRPTAGFFVDNISTMRGGPNTGILGPRKKAFKRGDGGILEFDASGNPVKVEMRHADVSGEFPLFNGTPALQRLPQVWEKHFTFYAWKRAINEFFARRLFFMPAYMYNLIQDSEVNQPQPKMLLGMPMPNRATDSPPVFSINGPALQVAQQDNPYFSNGGLEVWTEEVGWQTIDVPDAISLGDPSIIDLAPMSPLVGGASLGDTLLNISSLEELEMTGDYFEAGDLVVINPGGLNEEFAIIKAPGALELTAPLLYDHDPAEPVVFVERGVIDSDGDGLTDTEEADIETDPHKADTDLDTMSDKAELAYGTDPLDNQSVFKIVSFGSLNGGESVVFSWTYEPGKTYKIEVSPDLSPDSWTEVAWDIDNGEQIQVDYLNSNASAIFYRVRLDY